MTDDPHRDPTPAEEAECRRALEEFTPTTKTQGPAPVMWSDASLLRRVEDDLLVIKAYFYEPTAGKNGTAAYVMISEGVYRAAFRRLTRLLDEVKAHHDAADVYNDEHDPGCVACGQPRSEHIGPPAPPLTRGHLGATEDRPGSCRTTTGVHVHQKHECRCAALRSG